MKAVVVRHQGQLVIETVPDPTPEPTPYPAFDPSTVRLRLDRFADGFDAPVYIADDGVSGGHPGRW